MRLINERGPSIIHTLSCAQSSSPQGGEDRTMPFNDQAQLDPSQVEDRRGRGVGPLAIGGGGIGLVVLLVAMFLGINPSDLGVGNPSAPPSSGVTQDAGSASTLQEECQKGS